MSISSYIASKTFGSDSQNFSGFIIRLTTAAVALSVAIMIVAVCIIKGFRTEISEKIFGVWGHIHATHINSQQFQEVPLTDTMDWISEIKNLKDSSVSHPELGDFNQPVNYVQHSAHMSAILRTSDALEGLVLKGVDSTFNWDAFQKYIDGDAQLPALEKESRTVMISRLTANRLSLTVGDDVILYFIKDGKEIPRKFSIENIYHTGVSEFDEKLAFVPLSEVRAILGWSDHQIGGIEVFVNDLDRLEQFSRYVYFEIVPMDIVAKSITNKLYPIFQWLELQKVNERIILLLMIIICILNMATGILILIFERTRMVGVLQALGFPFASLRNIFLHYAGFILLRGLFWGNIVGLGFCAIQFFFQPITLDEQSYYISYAPIYFDWLKIFWINVVCALLILSFMLLPVYFLKKIDPVKALGFR
jgi:lipoprotein-releasing system permease protein